MKTAELEGVALDYWVARAEGYRFWLEQRGEYRLAIKQKPGEREPYRRHQRWETEKQRYIEVTEFKQLKDGFFGEGIPKFSSDWASGGPLIEREGICTVRDDAASPWGAGIPGIAFADGPTPLMAAMRAYVASKFGDEVEDIKEPS